LDNRSIAPPSVTFRENYVVVPMSLISFPTNNVIRVIHDKNEFVSDIYNIYKYNLSILK